MTTAPAVPASIIEQTQALRLLYQEFARMRGLIRRALAYSGGSHTTEDVLNNLINGQLKLWTNVDSFGITEIEYYPRTKICHIFLAGGNLKSIGDIESRISHYAELNGCDAVTLTGRKGWARTFLTHRGYKTKWVVLVKDLKAQRDGERQ